MKINAVIIVVSHTGVQSHIHIDKKDTFKSMNESFLFTSDCIHLSNIWEKLLCQVISSN